MLKKLIYFDILPIEFDIILDDKTNRYQISEQSLIYLSSQINAILYEILRAKTIIKPKNENKTNEEQVKPKSKWSDAIQLSIKNIANQLKITKSEEFNPFVISWSLGHKQTYKDLTPDNITDFLDYVKKEYGLE